MTSEQAREVLKFQKENSKFQKENKIGASLGELNPKKIKILSAESLLLLDKFLIILQGIHINGLALRVHS